MYLEKIPLKAWKGSFCRIYSISLSYMEWKGGNTYSDSILDKMKQFKYCNAKHIFILIKYANNQAQVVTGLLCRHNQCFHIFFLISTQGQRFFNTVPRLLRIYLSPFTKDSRWLGNTMCQHQFLEPFFSINRKTIQLPWSRKLFFWLNLGCAFFGLHPFVRVKI